MTDTQVRREIHRILHLTRNPNAPNRDEQETRQSLYGYTLYKCPSCGSWEHKHSFYGHWSRDHAPDWKVEMLMEVIKRS